MVKGSFSKANDDSTYAINEKKKKFLLVTSILLRSSLSSSPHFKTVLLLFKNLLQVVMYANYS